MIRDELVIADGDILNDANQIAVKIAKAKILPK